MRCSWTSCRFLIVAGILCAAIGCSSVQKTGIDPTGEHVFTPPPPPAPASRANEEYYDNPLGQLPWDDVSVMLQPRETVASVGSEVVLIAGVCGPDGYLRTNRRLEWSIDPGSTGQFVAVGETGFVDLLVGDFNRPRKITNTFAIGSTLRSNTRLNRGTCIAEDSAYVLRGQGWITLTSPTEGTSHVTVFAPEVYRWDSRLKSAVVHWVDAQWRFPPPAINPAGTKHVFTTTVVRQTNQTPCERWRVRYEIQGGPPAGFSPDGAQSIEVPTDSAGQASVEIFEKEPRHGVNNIKIEVIRPGDLPGANGQRLVVGSGMTSKTWRAADLSVKTSGPATAGLGTTLNYRITVANPGDQAAKDAVAVITMPEGLTFLNSNPAAETAGRQLQWRLGEIGGRQQRTIDASFRAERQGSIMACCEVTAAGGLKVSDCATTTIGTASLDVRITGPEQAAVGSQATFEITVRNLSQAPAAKLIIKDRLDPGLENPAANQNNAIERLLGDLAAGASQRVKVTVRVTKAGRLCQTVEVSGKDVTPASTQACIVGTGGGAAPAPAAPGGTAPSFGGDDITKPAPGGTLPITVKTTGPQQLVVGETAKFFIEITNTGTTELRNLQVLARYDAALLPVLATEGYLLERGALSWTIDRLAAGKTTQRGIHYSCQSAAAKACNRVSVTALSGGKVEDQACLEIRATDKGPVAPPAEKAGSSTARTDGLTMSVSGLGNPVAVNKDLTYVVQVTNNGTASYQRVTLTATVPEGVTPNPIGTSGPGPTKFAIEGKTIQFDPVFEIKPGESLMYRIRVRTKKAGQYRFAAELTAPTLSKPVVQEANTVVF